MKITKQDIRDLVSYRVYERGVVYYHQGRVQLLTQSEDSFSALVRGSKNYQVFVDYHEEDDWFDVDCTCPYWDVCKHIVAAMLTAKREYETLPIEVKGGGDWNKFFHEIKDDAEITQGNGQKYRLLFLLQVKPSGWFVMPKKQTIRQDGSLGVLRNIGYGDFFNNNIKRGKSDDLVLSLLDKWKSSQLFYSFSYDLQGAYGYKFGEQNGMVFQLLREARSLYFFDAGNCGNPVLFSETKGRIEFRLEENEDSFRFNPYLVVDGRNVVIDESFKILTSDPVWLLQDETLIEIDDFAPARSIVSFTQTNGNVTIPKEDFPQFFNMLMAQSDLIEYFQLPKGIRKENCESLSEKRLYLVEYYEGLRIDLKFVYGSAEIDYNDTRATLWAGNMEGNVLLKVTRNRQLEQEAHQLLMTTRVKILRGNEVVTRKNKTLEWLIEDVPELLKSGFVVFGEENLQQFKINRAAPQVSVSVESGIDWFDLDLEVDLGGVLLSLQELKKAIRKKSAFVRLDDGSVATLPKNWLNRFKHTLNLAEQNGEKLKFSSFHATLIDELFAEATQKEFDKPYKERLKKLQDFKDIKKVKPPAALAKVLRPYQVNGYHWLNFLKEYDFGGCLADDMGLEKRCKR